MYYQVSVRQLLKKLWQFFEDVKIWPKWLQLEFCAVRSKSCNSKSNCPIGIKIDMYTLKKYVKAGWKGFFFILAERGMLTPVSWRKSKFVTKEMAPADRLLKVSFETLITSSVFKIFKIYKMLLKNKSATIWNIFLKVQDLLSKCL